MNHRNHGDQSHSEDVKDGKTSWVFSTGLSLTSQSCLPIHWLTCMGTVVCLFFFETLPSASRGRDTFNQVPHKSGRLSSVVVRASIERIREETGLSLWGSDTTTTVTTKSLTRTPKLRATCCSDLYHFTLPYSTDRTVLLARSVEGSPTGSSRTSWHRFGMTGLS